MIDSIHVKADVVGGVAIGRIKVEKITEREAAVVVAELTSTAENSGWKLAIDMSDVLFMASSGLGAIIAVHKNCVQNGGKMAVFGLRDDLLQLLKLTKLNKLFPIEKNEKAALKAIR